MLYLVSTPIGNLKDITLRALETLKLCDYILAEDTRNSSVLLKHYGIEKPLLAFHKFNEKREEAKVLKELKEGKNIALITDGGTPIISDPGFAILKKCAEEDISFTAIPGPCSAIQGLLLSALPSEEFHFFGFTPKKKKEATALFQKALSLKGSSIFFESPLRIISTLKLLLEIAPKQRSAIAREMTKKFEECLRGTPEELLEHFMAHPPKGEMVLIVEGGLDFKENLPLEELIELLRAEGHSLKEALKLASRLKKIPKREAYKEMLRSKNSSGLT